ncbi:V/A-type H+-transporting ATPase subunit E [Aminivibrio pyruvatiphilus]|jgi:V/A-type H+-transporting ATPase subunit E|uniref:V/A-type H+-transporting ATPase subunit E n=1 Tax=Aminivibrio pyruvatiphilus TaxID=1005740 RepID=A0A4R8M623_9BACT|nr:V-type ATP synthase subunit E [Aminivibrio pyruvatiphilus]TDY56092.1 V/A-type H+-transporting ATPase subunit E [Aminivibrio pyruvatiphilus]
MSLAEIKKKIDADAQEEAGKILEKARSVVESINKEADGEIRKIEETYGDRFRKEQPEILRRREIVAGLDVKKIELGVKQTAISDAFSQALAQLAALPGEKYLALAGHLLLKATETGDEAVIVSGKEKHITQEWLAGFNEKHGKKFVLDEEKRPMSGGFILKKGQIETNCSWDMLTRWVRDDIEADVVKRLFSA